MHAYGSDIEEVNFRWQYPTQSTAYQQMSTIHFPGDTAPITTDGILKGPSHSLYVSGDNDALDTWWTSSNSAWKTVNLHSIAGTLHQSTWSTYVDVDGSRNQGIKLNIKVRLKDTVSVNSSPYRADMGLAQIKVSGTLKDRRMN